MKTVEAILLGSFSRMKSLTSLKVGQSGPVDEFFPPKESPYLYPFVSLYIFFHHYSVSTAEDCNALLVDSFPPTIPSLLPPYSSMAPAFLLSSCKPVHRNGKIIMVAFGAFTTLVPTFM